VRVVAITVQGASHPLVSSLTTVPPEEVVTLELNLPLPLPPGRMRLFTLQIEYRDALDVRGTEIKYDQPA
jgi:hypothetical protein